MENTFATEHGVVNARSARNLTPSLKWKEDIILSLKAVPWGLKSNGDFGPPFFFNDRGQQTCPEKNGNPARWSFRSRC